ncbi:MAG TPA: methyltransferase domain-containing protein [Chryseosolibacter sp.]|nr:methyltransferase domain-containing protein [Chryseosolibacter sp.]
METTSITVDPVALEEKVKKMYRDVALNPMGEYHFEMGSKLAERLGYDKTDLDLIPPAAIESFAGVGYYFDLARIKAGESVLDLGSGSGMDSFIAALKVGASGKVTGVDMTDEQLTKAERLRKEHQFDNVAFQKSYIENMPFSNASFDVAISNGVINLSPKKDKVFAEISRVLKPGGRMVIADIITQKKLPENITCDPTLWAACIGGASQHDDYLSLIERAGLKIMAVRDNEAYSFISKSARGATKQYGVKSVSIHAQKV